MPHPLPALTPELLVHDLSTSLGFYCGLLGFRVLFERAEHGFAAIGRGEAALMLEQIADTPENDDPWVVGPLDAPLGRGINLQITVDDIESLHQRLLQSEQRLRLPLEDVSYQADAQRLKVRQFMLQDPDGYLLRQPDHQRLIPPRSRSESTTFRSPSPSSTAARSTPTAGSTAKSRR